MATVYRARDEKPGRTLCVRQHGRTGRQGVALESVKIRDIVDRAVTHQWSIPEFQRGFVWKATQVRDLIESLWLDYPIGSMLVWGSKADGPPGGPDRPHRPP